MDELKRTEAIYSKAADEAKKASVFAETLVWIREVYDARNGAWEIRKSRKFFGYTVTFQMRSSKSMMGRFGGGFNWIVGVEVGASTIILNLLVAMVRIDKPRKAVRP